MVSICKGDAVATLINVFTVSRENQQRLVDLLLEATDQVMKRLPGFVSASIHKSVDGVRVVNYAQWRTTADFEAMMANEAAHEHMKSIRALAGFDAHLYVVAESRSVYQPPAAILT